MPENYTHVYLAGGALARSGNTAASRAAFMAGACGPDPLYMYHLANKQRKPNLPALAASMHREKTGAFLLALINGATTPVQQSYTLGFITHYTTDCTLNPYLAAMARPGLPYNGANGRWVMGAALDSALYHRDFNTRLVPLHASTPVLINEDLAQVCTLLRGTIAEVYGKQLPLLALADTFHDNLAIHRLMVTSTGIKKIVLSAIDDPRVAKTAGPLTVRRQPGQKLRRLPQQWENPFTGDTMDLTLDEVLGLAQQTGAICITAAMRYWLGELDEGRLQAVLGDNDYTTGLPCAVQDAAAETQPEAPAEHSDDDSFYTPEEIESALSPEMSHKGDEQTA